MKTYRLSTNIERIAGICFSVVITAALIILLYALRGDITILIMTAIGSFLLIAALVYYVISVTKADESNISQLPEINWDHVGGCEGAPVTQAILDFSYQPSYYDVQVEGRNGEEPYTVKGTDIKDGVLKLAPYSANYRVYGLFRSHRETMYEMEFYFKIILPEE